MPETCTIDGCQKPTRARGVCVMHWQRWRRHGSPLWTPPPPQLVCSIGGCLRPHYGRGWCKAHYELWRTWGTTDGAPPVELRCPPELLCSAPRCVSPHEVHGYCRRHAANPPAAKIRSATPTYETAHRRLCDELLPSMLGCQHCGGQAHDWAYDHNDPDELTSQEGLRYSANPRRYFPLCRPCHVQFDQAHRDLQRWVQARQGAA